MAREFRMPSLGADMAAGTLVEWRVQPGSVVHRGDVVALVETEKGIIDIESYVDGTVESLAIAPGTRVPVGTVLALFTGAPDVAAMPAPQAAPTPIPKPLPAPAAGPQATTAPAARLRISPAARARAAALGVDVTALQATGPDGVVTLRDVEAAAAAPAPQPPAGAGMRHAIAASMSRAKREIPHYYLQLGMDLGPTLQWLEAHNAAVPVAERLLLAALQIKAVARAAVQKPGFSGWFEQDRFVAAPAVNVGMAIALRGGGLVAPAISAADSKGLPVVMQELQDLVARVRRGRLRSTELASATITITSLGDEGVDTLWPIIHPPQVAILGFGSTLDRPWVVEQQVLARPVMNISLAADHRVSDGRQGAQFLARVRDLLAKPAEL